MKKIILGLLISPLLSNAQFIAMSNDVVSGETQQYVQNSPTNAVGNRRNIVQTKDSTYQKFTTLAFYINSVRNTLNHGVPTSMLFTDANGLIQTTPISNLSIPYSQITGAPSSTPVNLTAGRGIQITGSYPNLTISLITPTVNIVARSLNSNFTPNSTKEVLATYTVTCSVTNPLLVGTSTATAFLEYSINGGSSWLLPSQVGNSSGVGITVTVQLTNGQTGTLVGMIPANALVRIRTNTTGSGAVSYVTGQEVFY